MDDRLDRDAASISSANRLKSSHQTATRLVSKPVLSHFSGFFHSAEFVQEKKKDHTNPHCVACYSTIDVALCEAPAVLKTGVVDDIPSWSY